MLVPSPFLTIATQNPIEQEGTYPLPEAQVDRFLLMLRMDYPSQSEENALVETVTGNRVGDVLDVSLVPTIMNPEHVLGAQRLAAQLRVDEAVNAYAVEIVRHTRSWPGIRFGAGPRGAIALIRAGRAAALLQGRDFLTPDDIKSVALPVLRHRIMLAPELELEGQSADGVLEALLEQVKAVRQ